MSLTKIEQALRTLEERERTMDAFFDPLVPFPIFVKGKTPRHRYADSVKGDTAVARNILDAERVQKVEETATVTETSIAKPVEITDDIETEEMDEMLQPVGVRNFSPTRVRRANRPDTASSSEQLRLKISSRPPSATMDAPAARPASSVGGKRIRDLMQDMETSAWQGIEHDVQSRTGYVESAMWDSMLSSSNPSALPPPNFHSVDSDSGSLMPQLFNQPQSHLGGLQRKPSASMAAFRAAMSATKSLASSGGPAELPSTLGGGTASPFSSSGNLLTASGVVPSGHFVPPFAALHTAGPTPAMDTRPVDTRDWTSMDGYVEEKNKSTVDDHSSLYPTKRRSTLAEDADRKRRSIVASSLGAQQNNGSPPSGLEDAESRFLSSARPQSSSASIASSSRKTNSEKSSDADSDVAHRTKREFYFLYVKIRHSTSVEDWKFDVHVTDVTDSRHATYVYRNVRVNARSEIIFSEPDRSIMDCVNDFGWVDSPEDLYGHTVRIQVFSVFPRHLRVVDTTVTFGNAAKPENVSAASHGKNKERRVASAHARSVSSSNDAPSDPLRIGTATASAAKTTGLAAEAGKVFSRPPSRQRPPPEALDLEHRKILSGDGPSSHRSPGDSFQENVVLEHRSSVRAAWRPNSVSRLNRSGEQREFLKEDQRVPSRGESASVSEGRKRLLSRGGLFVSEEDEFSADSANAGESRRPQSSNSAASLSSVGSAEDVSEASDAATLLPASMEAVSRSPDSHADDSARGDDNFVLDDEFDDIIAEDWGQDFDVNLNKIAQAKAAAKPLEKGEGEQEEDARQTSPSARPRSSGRPQSAHSKFRPSSSSGRLLAVPLSSSLTANMEDDSPDGLMVAASSRNKRRQKSAKAAVGSPSSSVKRNDRQYHLNAPLFEEEYGYSNPFVSGHEPVIMGRGKSSSGNRVFIKTSRLQEPLQPSTVSLTPARRPIVSQQSSRPRHENPVSSLIDQLRSRNKALEANVAELQISNAEKLSRPRTSLSNR
eukprot:ANDGO_06722.mRNA.1 hypothetical protein H310_11175